MLSDLSNIIWAGVPVLCLNYLAESSLRGMHQMLLHLMLASDLLLGQLTPLHLQAKSNLPSPSMQFFCCNTTVELA